METTKNELTARQKKFLSGLSNYLDTTFYYFGSIQRDDYIKGHSDIDIDIFTDNEESMMTKLSHYLRISKKSFRKVVWKLRDVNKVAIGYKVKFINDFITAEFCVYNVKIKKELLHEHNSKIIIPFYCTILLNFIKLLYYKLHILSDAQYAKIKRKIFTYGLGRYNDDEFVLI